MAKFKTTTAILQILSLHCVDVIVVWNSRIAIENHNADTSHSKTRNTPITRPIIITTDFSWWVLEDTWWLKRICFATMHADRLCLRTWNIIDIKQSIKKTLARNSKKHTKPNIRDEQEAILSAHASIWSVEVPQRHFLWIVYVHYQHLQALFWSWMTYIGCYVPQTCSLRYRGISTMKVRLL